jgi:phage-related protein
VRDLLWVGSSHDDLVAFPEDVRHAMGFALYRAQLGRMPSNAKPLKGFDGASVVEISADHDGDTYRTVYTVRLQMAVYVLHAFQKKSTRGIATSTRDVDMIKSRLALARQDDDARLARMRQEEDKS